MQGPDLLLPSPFLRLVLTVSNLEAQSNNSPWTKYRIVSAYYKSSDYPKLNVLLLQHNPWCMQVSTTGLALCVPPVGLREMGI